MSRICASAQGAGGHETFDGVQTALVARDGAQQDDAGGERPAAQERGCPVGRGNDLHVGLGADQVSERLAQEPVALEYEDPDGARHPRGPRRACCRFGPGRAGLAAAARGSETSRRRLGPGAVARQHARGHHPAVAIAGRRADGHGPPPFHEAGGIALALDRFS
jgi:hypothetical protein